MTARSVATIAARDESRSSYVGGVLVLGALSAVLAISSVLVPGQAAADSRTFPAVADAQVVSGRPSVNYGAGRWLVVSARGVSGATRRSYLKFKVSLPAGAKVTGARLALYAITLDKSGTSLWRTGNGWTERGLRWRNRPAVRGRKVDRDRGTRRGWHELRAGVVRAGTRSFVLRGRGTRLSRYHSREGANDPQLVVTYSGAGPALGDMLTCPVATPQTGWRAPGSRPLTDAQAAACVARSGENRMQNVRQNARVPTAAELDAFHAARDSAGRTPAQYNPNFGYVTGGAALYGLRSTDDLIEWSAYKWGIPEDFVRGQMALESGWSMLMTSDRRDWDTPIAHLYPALAVIDDDSVWESLGIAQIRWRHTVPWNAGVEPLRWQSTGFAMDYSQALIRYYYDGYCNWCGGDYHAGDVDGAYRTYVSGSWSAGQWYADEVRANAATRPWQPVPPPRDTFATSFP
jgi:hypothetical protein